MTENKQTSSIKLAYAKGTEIFLRYLLAIGVFFFVFSLGAWSENPKYLSTVVGSLGQVLLFSSMLFGTMVQIAEETSKEKARRYNIINWVCLVSAIVVIVSQFFLF